MKFKIIKNEDYWLEMAYSDGCEKIVDGKLVPVWNIHVVCKWDGCIDYRSFSNGYEYDHECKDKCGCCEDYIHICSIDNFIDQLKQIKEQAVKHYGDDWANE